MAAAIAKENTHPEIRRERQGEINDKDAVKDITARKAWATEPDNNAREEPRARMGKARQCARHRADNTMPARSRTVVLGRVRVAISAW